MSRQIPLSNVLMRARGWALAAGVAGTAGCAAGYVLAPRAFFAGYLVGWLFWLGVALGCVVVSMIHNSTGGAWGIVLRPVLESAGDTVALIALLFVPLVFGMHDLYPWTNPEIVSTDAKLEAKAGYLNIDAFLLRTLLYLILWILLAVGINRWSPADDDQAKAKLERRRARVSNPGLIVYGLSITFASIDWVMSIEPHWYSTMYGTLYMAGQTLAGIALAILLTAALAEHAPWNRVAHPARFHDMGNLLLTAAIFWMYIVFMQFLLIWAGNLTEENPFYVVRLRNGWEFVALAVVVLHFAVPFAALLSRDLKRDRRRLGAVAAVVLASSVLDWYWLVVPPFDLPPLLTVATTVAALVAIGGFWLALFVARLDVRARWPIGEYLLEGNLDERPQYEAH